MAGEQESFEEFWRHYLRHHARSGTRLLHLSAPGSARSHSSWALVTINPMIALIGTGVGYLFAWAGHFLVERNRPAMVSHPTGRSNATSACSA